MRDKDVINLDSEANTGANKRIQVQLALLEQSQTFMQSTIDRIERKLDTIEKKIDKVEVKIYANLKWVLGLSIPLLISFVSVCFDIYEYVKH